MDTIGMWEDLSICCTLVLAPAALEFDGLQTLSFMKKKNALIGLKACKQAILAAIFSSSPFYLSNKETLHIRRQSNFCARVLVVPYLGQDICFAEGFL